MTSSCLILLIFLASSPYALFANADSNADPDAECNGCSIQRATNYQPYATQADDASCIVPGCTNRSHARYDPLATQGDCHDHVRTPTCIEKGTQAECCNSREPGCMWMVPEPRDSDNFPNVPGTPVKSSVVLEPLCVPESSTGLLSGYNGNCDIKDNDSCSTSHNGVCSDGGPGAQGNQCGLGTDFPDCPNRRFGEDVWGRNDARDMIIGDQVFKACDGYCPTAVTWRGVFSLFVGPDKHSLLAIVNAALMIMKNDKPERELPRDVVVKMPDDPRDEDAVVVFERYVECFWNRNDKFNGQPCFSRCLNLSPYSGTECATTDH